MRSQFICPRRHRGRKALGYISAVLYLSHAGNVGTLSGEAVDVPAFLNQGDASTGSTPALAQQPPSTSEAGPGQGGEGSSQAAHKTRGEAGTKAESHLLPASGLPPIPGHLVKAIKEGRFIELSNLLPEALREMQFEKDSERKEDTKGKKKHTIATPLDWMVAFTAFTATTVHFSPRRAFELAAYSSIILTLARDIKGTAWMKYDRLFRQAAAVNPQLQWHRREQDIWLMSVTESASSLGARPPSQQSSPPAQRSVEICKKWNKGYCPFSHCRFRHVCYACQEPGHITRECRMVREAPQAPAEARGPTTSKP